MFSDKYKKDNEKVVLDEVFKKNLAKTIKKGDVRVKRNNKKLKGIIAAVLAIGFISGAYFMTNGANKIDDDALTKNELEENIKNNANIVGGNIGETSMVSFLRYDGKDYRNVFHNIDEQKANELKGEKLGTTIIGEIDEEFSSQMAGADIYTVKGYDDKSVLIGILKIDTEVMIDVYSYYNESEIKTGDDLISKMKIDGNINKVKVIDVMGEAYEKEGLEEIKVIIDELKISDNKLEDKEFMEAYNSDYEKECKTLNIELKDGIIRTIDIYKKGYVYIDGYIFDLPNKDKILEVYNKL